MSAATSSARKSFSAEDVRRIVEGERAELAKSHAQRVARAFHSRLDDMSAAMSAPADAGVVTITQHGPGKRG